ncbi:DUF29 domain-containing protein [Methylobacterium sp. NEAU 140]|uniref:DUF29 domain-containing protein n=1 Tax=Methylobacterium sp. NEAU 140 TaxID=3064945 RepID=UPI002734E2D2|nr:DUF29 domain-containing protein [Methylobacterium sp. NEAU 140]MDP4024809.1 DUF29 domain-containing protein [Methylobacterium sp. NEAU 140]
MPRTRAAAADDRFEADLAAWADAQARALREGRSADLDAAHLARLVEDLALERKTELQARLGVILTGLLRWAEQVDLRGHSWAATIDIQRLQVDAILEESPSLRPAVADLIAAAYPEAKARAVLESALFDESFSESCPFTDDEVLRVGFLPDPYGDDAVRGAGWWKRHP